jgi:hypothetical protein
MIDLERMIENVAVVTVPVIIFMWRNRNQAKKEQTRKHQENQKLLEELVEEHKYFPLHEHLEQDGPLQAKGVRKKPLR